MSQLELWRLRMRIWDPKCHSAWNIHPFPCNLTYKVKALDSIDGLFWFLLCRRFAFGVVVLTCLPAYSHRVIRADLWQDRVWRLNRKVSYVSRLKTGARNLANDDLSREAWLGLRVFAGTTDQSFCWCWAKTWIIELPSAGGWQQQWNRSDKSCSYKHAAGSGSIRQKKKTNLVCHLKVCHLYKCLSSHINILHSII